MTPREETIYGLYKCIQDAFWGASDSEIEILQAAKRECVRLLDKVYAGET